MKKSKRLMRRAILARLFDHLQQEYSLNWSRERVMDDELSEHQLDALLAFKSDRRIDELRLALNRLSDGTYGVCLYCKKSIPQDALDFDPAQRICPACEEKITRASPLVHVISHAAY